MNPCTISNLNEVNSIVEKFYNKDTFLWTREKLLTSSHLFFKMNDEVVLSYNMIGAKKFAIHVIGFPKSIKELKNFIIRSGGWVMDNTDCTCIVAFVPDDTRARRMFVGLMGSSPVGTIEYENDTNEIVYVFTKDKRHIYEGRIS